MRAAGSYQFENLESRHIESARLAERAGLRLEGFGDLLIRHGFTSQSRILEVGIGHGIRARLMTEILEGAEVVGVDRSHELLSVARERNADAKGLSFVESDLYNLPFATGSFDFVYARLVFMHLNDPLKALRELKRMLRPGGRILIEDADRDCMFFEPAPASFAAFWEKVQEGQRRLGGDPNVGRKLASLLKESEFVDVKSELQPLQGAGPDIDFLVRTLMPSLNIYLPPEERAAGEQAIADLAILANDPRATFYHLWFVVSGGVDESGE